MTKLNLHYIADLFKAPAFGKKGIDLWKSCNYQTWSATAFLNMIFEGIAGYSTINGKFNPYLPDGIDYVKLNNFAVGNERYDLNIKRSGATVVLKREKDK